MAVALAAPLLFRAAESWSARRARGRRARRGERRELRDPGRERRAEQRARELLRSCVNDEEWGMYRDLGFIRVTGRLWRKDRASADDEPRRRDDDDSDEDERDLDKRMSGDEHDFDADLDAEDAATGSRDGDRTRRLRPPPRLPDNEPDTLQRRRREAAAREDDAPYAYLIYPHKPIVAYLPQTRELLNEYCVAFPDETRPYGSARLPDSDDVLAKWMALTGDERRLIATANMHLPGRQVDPKQVRRDLWRLSQWERERLRRSSRPEGSVPAP